MSLYDTFNKAAETVFNVFDSLVHSVSYVAVTIDFDGLDVESATTVDMIIDTFAERDTQFLSFSNLIQPTDVKGLVRGTQLSGVTLSTADKVRDGDVEYTVIAYSTDPAQAVYTLLLRNV